MGWYGMVRYGLALAPYHFMGPYNFLVWYGMEIIAPPRILWFYGADYCGEIGGCGR
jgi:hypothetical protein